MIPTAYLRFRDGVLQQWFIPAHIPNASPDQHGHYGSWHDVPSISSLSPAAEQRIAKGPTDGEEGNRD
jgi:hypothetical protein